MNHINKKKIILLSKKIKNMLGTVIRQISFNEFDKQIHAHRENGELTTNQIAELWHTQLKESLGDSFNINPLCRNYWMHISHFIYSPFYLYAYTSFGDCLVNFLYAVYKKGTIEDFQKKYTNMLSLDGKFSYKELLPVFGLDAWTSDFWQQGLNSISSLIDELEKLCN